MASVAVIAPSNTMADLPKALRANGVKRLGAMGYDVCFGRNANLRAFHTAGSLSERLEDFRGAISDPDVTVILPVFGGYNANQLLPHIDYSKLAKFRKTIVGFSDTTALLIAIHKFAGTPAIHGPSFSVLCDPNAFDYTCHGFQCVLKQEQVTYKSPVLVADDAWYKKKDFGPREMRRFKGWNIYRRGEARGPLIGGNLDTLSSLAGTQFFPNMKGCVLFLEDATGANPAVFHRQMTQLQQMGVFNEIKGLLLGIPPRGSPLSSKGILCYILNDVLGEVSYPVLLDVNCSHTDPMMSLPLGATAYLVAGDSPCLHIEAYPELRQ